MKKYLYIIIVALVAMSCVYEFTPDLLVESTKGLVVEGDILIGDISRISISAVEPLTGGTTRTVKGWAWIEDDAGGEYYPDASIASNSFEIDMTKASPDRKYRLRVRLLDQVTNSVNYSSTWKEPQKAPIIDELSYVTYDKDPLVHLQLSLSSNGGSGCFRWDYEEIWEYHAEILANYYYDVARNRVRAYDGLCPTYYCWAYDNSTQVGLAIAKSTSDEKIVKYRFLDLDRRQYQLQELYYIKLKARGISEECYEYLHTIELNSTSTGSLSQPDPSQVIGNLVCDDDPLEVVRGYIEVSSVSVATMFVDGGYYIPEAEAGGDVPPPILGTGLMTMEEAYSMNLRPSDTADHWVDVKCVDCTLMGGTKNKPAFWPTAHE